LQGRERSEVDKPDHDNPPDQHRRTDGDACAHTLRPLSDHEGGQERRQPPGRLLRPRYRGPHVIDVLARSRLLCT
jgi:hypothetical protein